MADKLLRYIRVYLQQSKIAVLVELEYRINFAIDLLGELLWTAVFWIFIEAVFGQVNAVAGWTKYEVLLIYGIARMSKEFFSNVLFENIFLLARYVNEGRLDQFLLKPISPRFAIAGAKLNPIRLISLFAGLLLAIYAGANLQLSWSLTGVLQILASQFLAAAVFAGMMFSFFSLSFWFGDISYGYFIFNELFRIDKLPQQALTGTWQVIFGQLFPVVLFGAIPAAVLLQRFDSGILVLYLLAAVFWYGLSTLLWQRGLAAYSSAN